VAYTCLTDVHMWCYTWECDVRHRRYMRGMCMYMYVNVLMCTCVVIACIYMYLREVWRIHVLSVACTCVNPGMYTCDVIT